MEDWLEVRRKVYTASEIAALVGSSKYLTPWKLYHMKNGDLPPEPESEKMVWGSLLEEAVIQRVQQLLGKDHDVVAWKYVHESPLRDGVEAVHTERGLVLVSPEECIGATPDAIVYGPKSLEVLLEVKTVDKDAHRNWTETKLAEAHPNLPGATRELPDSYVLQVQQQLHLTGLSFAFVAVLVGGNKLECYRVDYDAAIAEALVAAAREANADRIAGVEPAFDPFQDRSSLQRMVGSMTLADEVAEFTDDEAVSLATRIAAASADAKQAAEEADALKALMLKLMAERGVSNAVVPGVGKVVVVRFREQPEKTVRFKAKAATSHVRVYPEGEVSE